jgi:imidazolonepropionase-like amidohydrolase
MNTTERIRIVLLIGLVVCSTARSQERIYGSAKQSSGPILVITGGTLIDGTGSPPIRNSVVVIQGDRIVAVGSAETVKLPSKVDQVIGARGKWVIPGLIDSHIHFFQSGGLYTRPDAIDLRNRVPYAQEVARIKERLPKTFTSYLCSGVTSVVDVGGPFWNFRVREMAARTGEAPRVAVAGPLISTYAPPQLQADDPAIIKVSTEEEGRALVRRELDYKPDLIKIWYIVTANTKAQDTLPVIKAVIDESHAHGVRVAVHATELETATLATNAGADILVHGVDDTPVSDAFIRMVKNRGVIYMTTLVVLEGYKKVLTRQVTVSDMDRKCGDPQVMASWDELETMPEDDTFRMAGKIAEPIPMTKDNLKKMEDAGVTIAAGTDAGNIGTMHGPDIHREFEMMSEAGLTPMQILVAATQNAARVFSANPEMGTLEAGKLADLLILEADPLADIRNVRKIGTVIKGGMVFTEKDLVRNNLR